MSLDRAFAKIVSFHHTHQRMPSYRDLLPLLGFRSTNAVAKLVKKLLALGRLQQDASGRLLPTRYFTEIPWLGSVVAGYPSPAEEELLDILSLDAYLIHNKEGTYMLRVQGDSMIEAGIMPGDIVLVERRETAKPGDIVIAQVDGEWTMKTFRKQGRKVTLEAANRAYPPVVPQKELKIVAVVCALVRKY